jgi:hypothetical protein
MAALWLDLQATRESTWQAASLEVEERTRGALEGELESLRKTRERMAAVRAEEEARSEMALRRARDTGGLRCLDEQVAEWKRKVGRPV